MRPLWMGIVPGPLATRVLVVDGLPHTLLQARLPHSPRHPRALFTLAEALALWAGRPVSAALAADGPGSFCATTGWLDTFDALSRSPLVTITCSAHDTVPADPRPGEGLGDFADVVALLRRTVAR
jgi:hypothetical protein